MVAAAGLIGRQESMKPMLVTVIIESDSAMLAPMYLLMPTDPS